MMRNPLRCFIPLVFAVACPLAASPVKIMPVGDSITAGEHYGFPALEKRTGYRKPLYEMLTAAGYQVDFVGSQSHGIRPETAPDWFDWNCEAYPGWTIPKIADKLEAALTADRPDVLLVHVGTNGRDWEDKPSQVADLLGRVNAHAVASDRAVTVILCLIINRFAGEDAAPTSRFNQRVASMVAARTGDRIRIVLVDMEQGAGLDYSDRLPNPDATPPDEGGDMLGTRYPGVQLDRFHPNDKGNAKMALRLYNELAQQLGGPPDRRPGTSKESSERVDYSRRLTSSGAVPDYPVAYAVPTTDSVKAVIDRIGQYVMANTSLHVFDNKAGVEIAAPDLAHPNPNAVIDGRFTPFNRWDYPNGVTWSAFHRITDITGDQKYSAHAVRFYDWVFTWMPHFQEVEKKTGRPNEFSKMVRMAALDHCGAMTAGLIRTQLRSPDPRFRAWIDVVGDYISKRQFRLADGTLARERPQAVSLWTDDFYMGISFLAQMGRLTGDGKYWDDAIKQVTQGSARLFDERIGLYDHGWSENTDGYDPRFYWGRANGWAALAMTELLAELPAGHPGRDRVLHYYRQLMRGVVEQQHGTGLWHNVLDRHETYLESSASAMFVYALARGVNEGWLSPIYGPAALTGWNGLATRVLPDGRVAGICEGTTYANDHTYYAYRGAGSDTIFVGPVLYAGAEVIRLLQNPRMQIAAPRPDAVNSALHLKAAK